MTGAIGTTTATASKISAENQKYVTDYLKFAEDISDSATYDWMWTAYPDTATAYIDSPTSYVSTYADLNTNERAGLTALAARGTTGNTTIANGNTYIQDVLDGGYLPGTKTAFTTMLAKVTGKPNDSFATVRAMLGGSSYLIGDLSGENQAYTLTSTLATRYNNRATAKIYNDNYQSERKHQDAVITVGVAYAQQTIENAELLRKAGIYYRVWNQGFYTDQYKKKYLEPRAAALNRPEVEGNALRTLVGSVKTTTSQYHRPSPFSGMAAGAMAGAATGNPWGIAAGAALGLLTTQ